ncbi:GPI inositol-deacylase [Alternaria gaisen]|uniref:GPI inositol-deacylase n=1 Tax=Alternaria gaisen TaxID=167740 RepID=A0ACB6FK09_9PLEO|nr:GPI inositol-deacylase [Alternaria gaisen]
MRRRSSADPSSEQGHADSTADHSPAPIPEHEDNLDRQTEASLVNIQGWANKGRPKEEAGGSAQRLATDPVAVFHSPTAPRLPPLMAHHNADSTIGALAKDTPPHTMVAHHNEKWRQRLRSPWACSPYTVLTTLAAFIAMFLMAQSFLTRQLDVKGVPVLFVPGNAGSYKQVRSLAAEAAYHYHNTVQHDADAGKAGKRPLDFFSVDFNEDITAFHGQTLLDQAEYLNDAITYILSLYHTPGKFLRDPSLPDPTSVIVVGHSMGGVVARTMLTMPNYQANSINTIITLAAPHARPPVSFDGDIVRTYKGVNDYWRRAYSQKWAIDNPLWHVTLISIAGGSLDTMISSDYASIESLVPETHGFTVFSTSMPNVWTGIDHLAITWCDQHRKAVVRALYEVIDVSRATQTVPRAERMRGFKRWFLTGLEDIAEKTLPQKEAKTLLTLEENSAIISEGEKLVLRSLGKSKQRPNAHLIPVPPQAAGKKFTLLTSEPLDHPGDHGLLEVLFCSVFPSQPGQSTTLFSMNMDLSGDSVGATRLACKNAASDVIALPASTRHSTHPFKMDERPFSYLQYDLEDLAEHQFVAVVDKASERSTGWVVAEFSAAPESQIVVDMGLQRLLTTGMSLRLPAQRPLMSDINIPALHSALLAYNIHIGKQSCDAGELFAPLLRQYVTDIYESKFFVNVKDASINLHGVSPYMPPALHAKQPSNGLSLQIWSDPTCDSSVEINLNVDILGSFGKLWMRYRIIFAAFPILVVALVLRQQFRTYDNSGVFMSFTQGLNECLKSSLPLALSALTFLSIALAGAQHQSKQWSFSGKSANITSLLDTASNELLLGSDDTFFWFLVPLFGLMCIGVCVAINYAVLLIELTLASLYSVVISTRLRKDEAKRSPSAFAVTSNRQRVVTTCILLSLVSTVIPYHFAYVVLCLVQLATSVRAFRLARESSLDSNYNFYNYAHSIFILMFWILPINLPVLVVWVRNLAVHWMTPFSSHHNILSIMPFILLVETLSTGRMIPRAEFRVSFFTNILLFSIGAYAAVYGVTYAYVLHHLANILCAWLVAIHFDPSAWSPRRASDTIEGRKPERETKKRP